MDAYNEGADDVVLRRMYEQDKEFYSFDDCEYEICITAYALALGEVGEITPESLREVEAVIAKGAGVDINHCNRDGDQPLWYAVFYVKGDDYENKTCILLTFYLLSISLMERTNKAMHWTNLLDTDSNRMKI